jgi:hypothetical protein
MWNTDLTHMPEDELCLLKYDMLDTFAPREIILIGDKTRFKGQDVIQPVGYLWSKTTEYKEHFCNLDPSGTPVPSSWSLLP